jgi:beta-galactosidase
MAAITGPATADWKPAGDRIKTRWAAGVTPDNAWREYPRPQMVREQWRNLNGLWDYAVRPKNAAEPPPEKWNGHILVPYCIESSLSGIWQSVWLETVPLTYIGRLKIDTAIDPATITVRTFACGDAAEKLEVRAEASFGGHAVASASGSLAETVLEIADAKLWHVDAPHLYDLSIELLKDGKVIDRVTSYAGIRTIGKARDKQGHWRFTLNGKEIFHLGTLDQGWWPESLLTPPTEEAMRYDIDYLKSAGYNCIRNHIKVRPRRYYAHCDRVGMLIWQDQVSGPPHPKWTRMQPDPDAADWPQEAHEQFMF